MFHQTDDLRIAGLRPLIPPEILFEELPITEKASTVVSDAREEATRIVRGQDDRLLVIVGPCSIHDPAAALEYARRLLPVRQQLAADLCIFMRVYFEKPRTTVGWKGLINDPDLDGSFQINRGLRRARHLLLELAELAVPAGSEFLDTISPQFIADLISWGAIGARTTESQIHRELASGLSVPVGFKNGTDGNVQICIDAIRAAAGAHHFLSVTKQGLSAIVETRGNDACHVILRGSSAGPNHDHATIDSLVAKLRDAGVCDRVMIDCSHGNSRKDYRRQVAVAGEVAAQVAAGNRSICGLMLESHLVAGRQDLVPGKPLVYGQSITDACISWDETVPILEQAAGAARQRRDAADSARSARGSTK
ncbi:MAG TPA: 3-deoxy-7-phosphoheptulonate synthase [Candidatus Binatia bacterium]